MKKIILAATALSFLAGAPAMAANRDHRDNVRTERTVKYSPKKTKTVIVQRTNYRNWRKGERFDYRQARNYRQIQQQDYRRYNLRPAPRGYRWVQSGNDAVLIGITSGIVSAIIGNVIR